MPQGPGWPGLASLSIPFALAIFVAGCDDDEIDVSLLPVGDPGVETEALPPVLQFDARAAEDDLLRSPCDTHDDALSLDARVALTGGETYEHEVHDCQKLVLRDSLSELHFGPLAAVYPFDRAMASRSVADFRDWRPVAVIRRWSDADGTDLPYPPLHLSGAGACLWMKWSAGTWKAALDSVPCPRDPIAPMDTLSPALDVVLHRHQTGGERAVPRTARWGWDDTDGVHYIGLKCAGHWCSVGPRGFTPRESPDLGDDDAHVTIPGWYDEQHLAVESEGTLVPGPWGRILPTRDQYELRDDPLLETRLRDGLLAAGIRVSRHADLAFGGYETKFGLMVEDTVATARVFVRVMGTTGWAHFVSGVSSIKAAKNRFVSHVSHAAAGAVRWRWQETDETAWVSCRSGCCDIQP